MAPRTKNDPKNQSFGPLLGAMLGTKIDKNRSKSDPKGDHFFDWFWGRVLMAFGPNLAPTWRPKSSQNRPKLDQKSIKNWVKVLINFLLDFWSLWGRFLVNFASKLEGLGTKKHWKTYGFLMFLLFRPACQQEAIWSIFWSIWPSTWSPKSTKIRPQRLPKSIKKGIENMMQVNLEFGPLLGRFWVDFGAKLGPSWSQVGTKIRKMRVPRRCQKNDG